MKVYSFVKHAILAAICFAAAAWFLQNSADSVLIYSPFVMGLLAIAAGL